jgi:hypothetical protein
MPLTFFIPLGLILVVAGFFLHISTKYKLIAKLIIGLGLAITILIIGVIILAVNSM